MNEKIKLSELDSATPVSGDYVAGIQVQNDGTFRTKRFPFDDFSGDSGWENYAEVNVTSAQILDMGNTVISLRSPLAAGYYEAKIILEFTAGLSQYTLNNDEIIIEINGSALARTRAAFITQATNQVVVITDFYVSNPNEGLGTIEHGSFSYSDGIGSIRMYTYNGTNPTVGDGTIRAKIWYNVRTFGSEL